MLFRSVPQLGTASGGGVLLTGALERAARAVEAAYPQAARQASCDGGAEHCFSVSAEELPGQGQATVRAAISVPLRLSSLFGHNSLTVEHQEARKLERALLVE